MFASPPHEPVIRSQRGTRLVSSYRMTKRALPSGNPRREGVLLTTRTDYETHAYFFRKRFDTTAALRGMPRLHGRFAAAWCSDMRHMHEAASFTNGSAVLGVEQSREQCREIVAMALAVILTDQRGIRAGLSRPPVSSAASSGEHTRPR